MMDVVAATQAQLRDEAETLESLLTDQGQNQRIAEEVKVIEASLEKSWAKKANEKDKRKRVRVGNRRAARRRSKGVQSEAGQDRGSRRKTDR